MTTTDPSETNAPSPEIRICHISDFHLPLTRQIPMRRFMSKRLLGYMNLTFRRGSTHHLKPFEQILEAVQKEAPDLLVITGDVVNLALDFEFEELASRLKNAGFNRNNTVLIPGNHDRYTPGACFRADFEKYFADLLPLQTDNRNLFPIAVNIGPVAVIGLDTAIWRGPVRAAGVLRKPQLNEMIRLLDGPFRGQIPVVAVHHPPFVLDGPLLKHYRDGMAHGEQLIGALAGRRGVILHGHIHRLSWRRMADVDVLGVPSASNEIDVPDKRAAYNVYRLGDAGLISAVTVRYEPGHSHDSAFKRVELQQPKTEAL